MTNTANTDRATEVVTLAEMTGMDPRTLPDIFYATQTGDDSTVVHQLIRKLYSGDDDFDEFLHEVDHVTGACTGDDECMWADDEN